MANYSFTFKDDSLEHHGIDGQKWGVRNGPPYPLDKKQLSFRERRALKIKDKKIYKIVYKSKEKMWKDKDPYRKSVFAKNGRLHRKTNAVIHEHSEELKDILLRKGPADLHIMCSDMAKEILGKYANYKIKSQISKKSSKEINVGSAWMILQYGIENYIYKQWQDDTPNVFSRFIERNKYEMSQESKAEWAKAFSDAKKNLKNQLNLSKDDEDEDDD